MIEINFAGKREEAQPIFLNASLTAKSKQALLDLLRKLKDGFAAMA